MKTKPSGRTNPVDGSEDARSKGGREDRSMLMEDPTDGEPTGGGYGGNGGIT